MADKLKEFTKGADGSYTVTLCKGEKATTPALKGTGSQTGYTDTDAAVAGGTWDAGTMSATVTGNEVGTATLTFTFENGGTLKITVIVVKCKHGVKEPADKQVPEPPVAGEFYGRQVSINSEVSFTYSLVLCEKHSAKLAFSKAKGAFGAGTSTNAAVAMAAGKEELTITAGVAGTAVITTQYQKDPKILTAGAQPYSPWSITINVSVVKCKNGEPEKKCTWDPPIAQPAGAGAHQE